jgi:hypothetical protein
MLKAVVEVVSSVEGYPVLEGKKLGSSSCDLDLSLHHFVGIRRRIKSWD